MLMPARSGMLITGNGLPRSDAKHVRLLAKVLIRMPKAATEAELEEVREGCARLDGPVVAVAQLG